MLFEDYRFYKITGILNPLKSAIGNSIYVILYDKLNVSFTKIISILNYDGNEK
jgi:hypothetical protein